MSKVAIKGNASGTGTFTLEAPNSNTDRTLVLPDEAGTVLTSASDITPSAGAGFVAYSNSNQSISNNTWTQVVFGAEDSDTDNTFASNTFTSPVNGLYLLTFNVLITGTSITRAIGAIELASGYNLAYQTRFTSSDGSLTELTASGSMVVEMDSGQTAKVYVYLTGSSLNAETTFNNTKFSGCLLRTV